MMAHKHEWKPSPDQHGAYYCASGNCPDGMPEIDAAEVINRLNATEELPAYAAEQIADGMELTQRGSRKF